MPNKDPVVLNWSLARNTLTSKGDGPPFELCAVNPRVRLQVWGLNISDATNWTYPYRVKVVGGVVCMTRAEVERIIQDYLRLTADS